MKGSLIKQNRKYQGMTLEELADGICSVSYLSKIENNSITASDDIYRLLGERLNITLVDINQEFDEGIYQNLLRWHEACQLRDFTLMEDLHVMSKASLEENRNIKLVNLYKIIETRHLMTKGELELNEAYLKELEHVLPGASKEYKFFYHKTVGIHYLLESNLKLALYHFKLTHSYLEEIHLKDSETYFHLSLTHLKTREAVESNYYGEIALKKYKDEMNYSRMIDTYMIIALNYRYLNIHHIAEEYYEKILKIGKYHLPEHEQRRIHHNLGYIYANQEKYSDALTSLKKAQEISTPEKYFEISTIYLLASTSYYCGDLESCWSYIKEGQKQADEFDQLFFKHKFYLLTHIINETTHDDAFIHKLEKEIIPDMRKLNEYEEYKDYLEMLGDIYYEKRMYKKAAMNYKEANQFKFTQKKDLL
ncbi:XRE family transcriptional regulator [Halobacillus fulvus]|nr:XRE family transcriptional regulator [Halobacillus fulvus]